MLIYLLEKFNIILDTETTLVMKYGFLYEPQDDRLVKLVPRAWIIQLYANKSLTKTIMSLYLKGFRLGECWLYPCHEYLLLLSLEVDQRLLRLIEHTISFFQEGYAGSLRIIKIIREFQRETNRVCDFGYFSQLPEWTVFQFMKICVNFLHSQVLWTSDIWTNLNVLRFGIVHCWTNISWSWSLVLYHNFGILHHWDIWFLRVYGFLSEGILLIERFHVVGVIWKIVLEGFLISDV
jgi:hypothetical protein